MVLVRTIILKLILTICSTSSLDVINVNINKYNAVPTDPAWLTEKQSFAFDITSDIELVNAMGCNYPMSREFVRKLNTILELSTYYVYSVSTGITVTKDMQGEWICYIYYKSFLNAYWISINIDVLVDVNECNASPSPCSSNENCTNTHGGFECTCLSGYERNGLYCQDVNECLSHPCHDHHTKCHNEAPGYSCTCLPGFTGDGQICTDVDECNATHSCSPDASCTNTPGSYMCSCLSEYTGNGTYCQLQASDAKHTWKLVVVIVVVLIVVATVVSLMVDLYKRRQRQKKAIQSELNYESFENTTEGSMPHPAHWENYSLPVNRQNENATDTYSVPYQERNVEEMYAKPQPKSLRKPSHELGENPTYANLSKQTAEYSQIQIQPKILATEGLYSEVLPKSMRPNSETSKYVNVHDVQRYVNSDNGEGRQDRTEYAEPAYCEVGLKK